jgi:hypothetical protein
MQQKLGAIFANLDRWRHLPNYQLERRTDIFFSIYLKELIEEHEGHPLMDTVIPELPIKANGSARSFKVDYVLFSKDKTTAYFVELKTDGHSRRDDQDEYLRQAVGDGFQKVLEGLTEITSRTTSYRKYWHLIHLLSKAEVLKVSDEVRDYLYPTVRTGLRARLAATEVIAKNVEIRVIYIQPHKANDVSAENCIDFDEVIEHLKTYNDDFSKMFADHLKRCKEKAGDCEPKP